MARPTSKNVSKPDDDVIAKEGGDIASTDDGEQMANLEGYTGPDGSKSLGYLKHPPSADRSGLGSDADDAGRTRQEPGQNSGAGAISNVETRQAGKVVKAPDKE